MEVYQRTRWNLVWSELVNDSELEVACLGETLNLEQIYAGLAVAEVVEPSSDVSP